MTYTTSIGSRGTMPAAFSLLRRRVVELATCELLLLENYPWWVLVMPFYLLSYLADNSAIPLRPFHRIVRSTRACIARTFGLRIFRVQPFEALRLYCDLDSVYHVAGEHLRGETTSLLSSHDQVFLDLGAHYGLVATRIAAMLPSSQVIAIEAHPSNYAVLKKNLELNDLKGASAFNFAVATYSGQTSISAYDGISTHYTMRENPQGAAAIKVPCYRLGDILELLSLDHVDLVKMDIEGMELEVLQSSLPALAKRIQKLDIEVHQFHDLVPISKLLESGGYVVRQKQVGILSRSYRVLAEKNMGSGNPAVELEER